MKNVDSIYMDGCTRFGAGNLSTEKDEVILSKNIRNLHMGIFRFNLSNCTISLLRISCGHNVKVSKIISQICLFVRFFNSRVSSLTCLIFLLLV